jgi:capsular polysaccharide transport system permease protein
MTTRPKAARFFLRRVERTAVPPAPAAGDLPFDNQEDGFGNQDFRRPLPADRAADRATDGATDGAAAPGAVPTTSAGRLPGGAAPFDADADDAALAEIAAEGLTGKQLRRARLVAQKHGIDPGSDFDAVLQLRRIGIDPFSRSAMLEVVPEAGEGDNGAPPPPDATGRALARLPGDQVKLPARARPIAVPSTEQRADVNQAAEILRMQTEIARRRRRRLVLLAARMVAFVLLPTFLAGWYFYRLATPMYATKAEFVIQQAGPTSSGGTLGGLFSGTGLATSQDSVTVQAYLQSREAMARLEDDLGFRQHFQDFAIDPVQRLAPDATLEDAYGVYKRFVKISYDTTEGLVRMEVVAADPKVAAEWAGQLIAYAEEQVDHLTQRLRADQMLDAQKGYDEARANLASSQRHLVELQEKFKIISSETEVGLLTSQIAGLETQLVTERLGLAQIASNATPNQARMEAVQQRIATLEFEIATLRAKMTEGTAGGSSMAEVQGEMLIAQADMQTRQMILAQALQSMETARVEANRQVRYLSLAVSPTPTDAPAYPRAFENTLVTLLIMLGIYLMVSMTAAILREQVSA